MKKIFLLLVMLASSSTSYTVPLQGRSFFSPRSQSTNSVRNIVGVKQYIFDPNLCENWSLWTLTTEYSQAFSTRRVAEYFFGRNIIRFTGSQVLNRAPDDILADYFGLSTTFDSSVEIKPHLQSVIADFDFYLGLDGITKGLFFTVHAPAVWVHSKLELHEEIDNTGINTLYPPQYMSTQAIPAPLDSAIQAFKRIVPFGDVQEPLQFGRIDGYKKAVHIADIHAMLGWNFLLRETGHIGLNLQLAIPTGNHSKAEFLFEPIAGNGHHVELGIGATGHVRIWEKDGEQELGFYVDANFTHLFKSKQRRSFDLLRNGFGSRYILVKEFDENGLYSRVCGPAINKTTLWCDSHIDIQLEFLIMFGYQYCNIGFDFGYNGWLRSREKICLREGIPYNKYGLKGIQNVTLASGSPSQATQSTATLHGNELDTQAEHTDFQSPKFISTKDLNLKSAAAHRQYTHKFFAHYNYSWPNHPVEPFVGVGSDIEFEGLKPRYSLPNKNAMSVWSFWLKGGVVY